MTISFPPRIEAAIEAEAAKYGQGAPEFLKHVAFCAAHSKEGFLLKLELPPVAPDLNQLALPLGGGSTASEVVAAHNRAVAQLTQS